MGAQLQEPRRGTAAGDAADEQATARAVQQMFSAIAPRYDLLNHLLSFNIDRWWWRRAARTFRDVLRRPRARALDVCCGTGDMALALRRQGKHATILAADFSHPMLVRAVRKAGGRLTVLEADALQLPLPDCSADLVTSAFGFRNLANYQAGLREIYRVLRRDGEVGILDFSEPKGMLGRVYRLYFQRVLPVIGNRISGVAGAYSYLPASVERFPSPDQMLELMRAAGFRDVSWTPYTFGVAGLFRGRKEDGS